MMLAIKGLHEWWLRTTTTKSPRHEIIGIDHKRKIADGRFVLIGGIVTKASEDNNNVDKIHVLSQEPIITILSGS